MTSIARAPRNRHAYPDDLGNAYWTKTNLTVNRYRILAPGQRIGHKLTETAINAVHTINDTHAMLSQERSDLCVFAKGAERDWIYIETDSGNVRQYFDVTNGVLGTLVGTALHRRISPAGDGWFKCNLTSRWTAGNRTALYGLASADNINTYLGVVNSGAYLYLSQMGPGIGPEDYDKIPILTNQNTVVSPIDWTGAGWANTATVTPAAGLGPEGTLNANLLASTVAGQYASAALGALYPAGNQVWYCWVKNIDATSLRIRLYDTAAAAERVNVDFTWTGAVLGGTTINNGTDAFPVDMGNGWYCVWGYSNAIVAGNQHTAYVYPGGAAGTGRIYATNANQHPGQGPSRIVGQEVARS